MVTMVQKAFRGLNGVVGTLMKRFAQADCSISMKLDFDPRKFGHTPILAPKITEKLVIDCFH